MHKHLHSTINYKKLIEMQANETSYRIKKDKSSSTKTKPMISNGKVKSIGVRRKTI